MTFQTTFPRRAHTDAAPVPRDRSVELILFFLLALVFAPVVGLHVTLAVYESKAAITAPEPAGSVVETASPSTTRSRG
jgi:hypothetical protein